MQTPTFDTIIIGGSYAGLSAALALGRSLRKVLIIDSGRPCNRQTPHSHNFLTRDGQKPAELAALAKAEVLNYPTVQFLADVVTSASPHENGFSVSTHKQTYLGKKLVIASGVTDVFPPIKGFAECWGISVIHCPYCHGYEVHGQTTGIIANGKVGFEFAKLISNWTKDLTLFTNGPIELDTEHHQQLKDKHIAVVAQEIDEIVHENGQIKHLRFKDGSIHKLVAVYARGDIQLNTDFAAALPLELTEHGLIAANHFQQTSIPGVYAVGDCTTMLRSVASAVGAGSLAGAMINKELISEKF